MVEEGDVGRDSIETGEIIHEFGDRDLDGDLWRSGRAAEGEVECADAVAEEQSTNRRPVVSESSTPLIAMRISWPMTGSRVVIVEPESRTTGYCSRYRSAKVVSLPALETIVNPDITTAGNT